jgi:hypothetical protein
MSATKGKYIGQWECLRKWEHPSEQLNKDGEASIMALCDR